MGVGGAVGALIAVFVAIVGGTLAGLVVAGVGSVLFVVAVAYAQPPDPVLGGVLIIAVWCAAAVIAGVMTAVLRERANTAYREVEEARNTRPSRVHRTPTRLFARQATADLGSGNRSVLPTRR